MNPKVIEAGLVAAALAFEAGLLGLMLLITRPRGVRPQPATQDLGPEPPAVVSLLAGGWDLCEDAAESTLLDLGARKLFEFRQPADDPRHTTLHVRQSQPGELTPYERRVYLRVSALAVGGVVPLTALTFRDQGAAKSWWKGLRAEVIADARRRGLSRRRFGTAVITTMVLGAVLAAAVIAGAVWHYANRTHDDDPVGTALSAGFFAFVVLAAFGARPRGERDTPAGREAAARWLGVRDWLRGHPAFGDLPPAAVQVWDRYLSYGDAVGVTRVASAVIDLGMGDRKRVWSSFGGTWHRVRVRYPRTGAKYGSTTSRLLLRSVVSLAIGYVLVRLLGRGVAALASSGLLTALHGDRPAVHSVLDRLPAVGLLIGVALLAYGGYVLIRAVVDLFTPVTLTGQVLWKQVCASTGGGENSPPTPSLYHLAIDDGTGDTTRAWAAPPELARRCDGGDTVQAKLRRWSRRVMELKVTEAGHLAAASLSSGLSTSSDSEEALVAQMLGTATPGAAIAAALSAALSAPAVGTLFTDEEASQALGLVVVRRDAPVPGPVATTTFVTADRGKAVLMCQVLNGPLGKLAWRSGSRGQALPGIADGAFSRGDRAVCRSGDTVVVLTLVRDGKGRGEGLPTLLTHAAARISGQGAPPASSPVAGPAVLPAAGLITPFVPSQAAPAVPVPVPDPDSDLT